MTIKELFEKSQEPLTYEAFEKLMKESGAKFADLSEGNYVSKDKFENEVANKDGQINSLNDIIKVRDKDLKDLKAQLKEAGTDAEKLTELETQLGNLQSQYKQDTESYKNQLSQQAYEFAVKDFANTKKFSSNGARRDFINSMIAKKLQLENDKILGADDFFDSYAKEDPNAFIVEEEKKEETPKPQFSNSVNPDITQPKTNDNPFGFTFAGVRQRPNQNN